MSADPLDAHEGLRGEILTTSSGYRDSVLLLLPTADGLVLALV